ncbi:MAG TPA: hypothetical protein VGL69_20815 [Solirubrobacteraceae bacterium]
MVDGVVVDVATEEVPSDPERVGEAVVVELVVDELVVLEVEVVRDGVVNPEVVVEVLGGALKVIVVDVVGVELVDVELVVLDDDVEVEVELVVDVVVTSGTQLADSETWVRSSEPGVTKPPLTSASR